MQWANRRLSGPAFDIWSAGDRPWEGVTFDLARALLWYLLRVRLGLSLWKRV